MLVAQVVSSEASGNDMLRTVFIFKDTKKQEALENYTASNFSIWRGNEWDLWYTRGEG